MNGGFSCAAACGINVSGGAGNANQRHGFFNNTVAVDTTVTRSGPKSYRLDAAASAPSIDYTFFTTGQSVLAGAFAIRVSNATPGATARLHLFTFGTSGTSTCKFQLTTGGVLQFDLGAGAANGPTLVANRFYLVEYELNVSANPWTAKWRVRDDSTGAWTSYSAPTARALAADTLFGIKMDNSGNTSGINVYYTDMAFRLSTAAGTDYSATPANIKVLRYRVNADGTHSFTAGDFRDGAAGSNFATNATDIYTRVDDDDQSDVTTDFVAQRVINAAGYVEFGFEDEATYTNPIVVTVVQSHHSSAGATNACTTKVSDDNFTSSVDVWTGDNVGTTTIQQRGKGIASPPSGGSWTQAKVNSMKARWGYSSDVTPEPYLDSISLEVAWSVPETKNRMGTMGFFG